MPSRKKEDDQDFLPGYTRKKEGYDPLRDNRNISKLLLGLKGDKGNSMPL